MRSSAVALVLSGLLVVPACGSSGDDDDDDDDVIAADADPNAPDSDPNAPDGATREGWVDLLTGEWTLPAGTEGYTCVYVTLEQDFWFDGIEAIAPLGTHHTVLSVGPPQRADGSYPCEALTNYDQMLYASGVGTDRFTFPDGVGMHVSAGQQLLLNLHLFNFSESPLSGTSGNRVRLVDPADVDFEAEGMLAGTILGVYLPPDPPVKTIQGTCTMTGDTNVFALIPHMHMLGTHFKVVAESSVMGDVTIHDEPYTFDDQRVNEMDPIVPMKAGDKLQVFCTYNNTTGSLVTFGDSSLQEMCFSITYRYPALSGGEFICTN